MLRIADLRLFSVRMPEMGYISCIELRSLMETYYSAVEMSLILLMKNFSYFSGLLYLLKLLLLIDIL